MNIGEDERSKEIRIEPIPEAMPIAVPDSPPATAPVEQPDLVPA